MLWTIDSAALAAHLRARSVPFLPGPASRQVRFSTGRLCGGLAAWASFTLPSAIALVLFAYATKASLLPLDRA